MAHLKAFSQTTYYIAVGQFIYGSKCCIAINTQPFGDILSPFDGKYIISTKFTCTSPKKTLFNAIVTTLKTAEIYPDDDEMHFDHPINPDNHYYTSLNIDHLNDILYVIRAVASGLSIGRDLEPHVEETHIDTVTFERLKKQELPKSILHIPALTVLSTYPQNKPYCIRFGST